MIPNDPNTAAPRQPGAIVLVQGDTAQPADETTVGGVTPDSGANVVHSVALQHALVSVNMYAMGDRYDIPNLKRLASINFGHLHYSKDLDNMLPVIVPRIYSSTPDHDRGLRDHILEYCRVTRRDLVSDESVTKLAQDVPHFAVDLWKGTTYALKAEIFLKDQRLNEATCQIDQVRSDLKLTTFNRDVVENNFTTQLERMSRLVDYVNGLSQCGNCETAFAARIDPVDLHPKSEVHVRCSKCDNKHRVPDATGDQRPLIPASAVMGGSGTRAGNRPRRGRERAQASTGTHA